MELEQSVQKLDCESLVIYSLILEAYNEENTEIAKAMKKYVMKKIKNGENIKEDTQ